MRRWPAQGARRHRAALRMRESVAEEGERERGKGKWKRKRKLKKRKRGKRERDSLGGFRGGDRGRSRTHAGRAWRGSRRYATRGIGKERDDTVIDFGCRGGDPMGQVSGIRAQGFMKVLSSTMKIILAHDLILVNFSGCHTCPNPAHLHA